MRRALLAFLLIGCADDPAPPPPPAKTPLERGVEFLAGAQDPDGAWRSRHLSAYADGPSMTAWICTVSTRAPIPGVERGLDYLRGRLRADGTIDTFTVPMYTAALTLSAFVALRPAWRDEIDRIAAALARAQQPSGGWGNGEYADTSVTAFVLEALAAAGRLDAVRDGARRFVESCRVEGGYVFTPHPTYAFKNKAGEGRSYGTATADAARCLRALGEPATAPPSAEFPPGFNADQETMQRGLRFYWAFVSGAPVESLQRPDGSWANEYSLMNEDEPLIATGLAVAALSAHQARGTRH